MKLHTTAFCKHCLDPNSFPCSTARYVFFQWNKPDVPWTLNKYLWFPVTPCDSFFQRPFINTWMWLHVDTFVSTAERTWIMTCRSPLWRGWVWGLPGVGAFPLLLPPPPPPPPPSSLWTRREGGCVWHTRTGWTCFLQLPKHRWQPVLCQQM